jgi:hypothetical protein
LGVPGTLRQLQVLKRPPLVGGQKSEAIQEGLRACEPMTAHACFLVSCPMSVAVEAKITGLRSEQHVLVRELEYGQAPHSDGSRSMVDYVQSRLDIKRDTARDLVFAAPRFVKHRGLHDRMLNGYQIDPQSPPHRRKLTKHPPPRPSPP